MYVCIRERERGEREERDRKGGREDIEERERKVRERWRVRGRKRGRIAGADRHTHTILFARHVIHIIISKCTAKETSHRVSVRYFTTNIWITQL